MITDNLVDELAGQYLKLKYGEVTKDNYFCVKVNSRKNTNGNIVVVALGKKTKEPVFVIKIPRNPDYEENIINENNGINNAIELAPSKSDFIGPKLSIIAEADGFNVLLQEACIGEPLISRFTECSSVENYQYKMFDMLMKFVSSCPPSRKIGSEDLRKYIDDLTSNLNKLSHDSYDEISSTYHSVLERIPEKIAGESFYYVHQHGDFNPYNALISEDNIKIVDWEDYRKEDIPVIDLNHLFVCSSYLYGERGNILDKFIENVLTPGRYRDLYVDCAKKYCQKMNLGVKSYWLLSNIYFLVMAVAVCRDGRQEEYSSKTWIRMGNLYAENFKAFML